MTTHSGTFDDGPEEDPLPPLLPPQDRAWRHPSELDPIAVHPHALKRQWLLSHPSRRSVLTAGIVGALVASAIAAIATHLADSVSTAPPPRYIYPVAPLRPPAYAMSPEMRSAVTRVAAALAVVQSASPGVKAKELGVVIRSNGMLLAPSAGLARAQSLVVTLADGDVYVGSVVGTDPRSGLAVVHINGAGGLQTVAFSRSSVIPTSLALALWSPGHAASVYIGILKGTHSIVRVGNTAIIGAMRTDFTAAQCPIGSAVLSSTGAIDGVVVGDSRGVAVIAPAWLASVVARDLIATGSVVHGWLGVRGVTNAVSPGGVRIVSIAKGSALRAEGVRAGDLITSFGATPLRSITDLRARLYGLRPGDRVMLGIDENGKVSHHSVLLAASKNP